jgi:type II secretory pathway pseudopilin PulG
MLAVALVVGVNHSIAVGQTGKRAAQGAAAGAFWGLLSGGIGGAVEGAVIGGASGAIVGGVGEAYDRNKAKKAEVENLRAEEEQRAQAQQAAEQQGERERLENERRAIEVERGRLELARAKIEAAEQNPARDQQAAEQYPDTDEEWIAAIGADNYEALNALVFCQRMSAAKFAEKGSASENKEHRIAGLWLAALVAADQNDAEASSALFEQVAAADEEFETAEQVAAEADVVILEIRAERRNQKIRCAN